MQPISPCSEMFQCEKRFDDKELCKDTCAPLRLYRKYLDSIPSYDRDSEITLYNLPLADPDYVGYDDGYGSILALETLYTHNIEKASEIIDIRLELADAAILYQGAIEYGKNTTLPTKEESRANSRKWSSGAYTPC